ncbi:MAG: OmpA family protein [Azospirillaceae bacterium]|nr:OmpA family protein [Azospirillaceae bacterium]
MLTRNGRCCVVVVAALLIPITAVAANSAPPPAFPLPAHKPKPPASFVHNGADSIAPPAPVIPPMKTPALTMDAGVPPPAGPKPRPPALVATVPPTSAPAAPPLAPLTGPHAPVAPRVPTVAAPSIARPTVPSVVVAPPSSGTAAGNTASAPQSPAPGAGSGSAATSLAALLPSVLHPETAPTATTPAKASPDQPLPRRNIVITFDTKSTTVAPTSTTTVDRLIAMMRQSATMRLEIRGFAAGTPDTVRDARLLALKRAISVRQAFVNQGVPSTRINVRALGIPADGPADRVEIDTTE